MKVREPRLLQPISHSRCGRRQNDERYANRLVKRSTFVFAAFRKSSDTVK
jgi:hypothetical protein